MANVTRYDPFDIGFEPFDNLFRGFLRPVRLEQEVPQIKMDVKEEENAYRVHAEIPGVKKEHIHVSVEGNTISISAEIKKESEEKEGEKVLKRERHYGRMARSFALGNDIDETNASAKYTDGVLELVLPKKQGAGSKKLSIQ